MNDVTTPGKRLVADIGGTNSRLALFDAHSNELSAQHNFINRDHACFGDVIANWLQISGEQAPDECCLAIAAPPFDNQVTMLNMDWSFSLSELAQRFGFARIAGVNDFVGNAYSLPHLPEEDLATLHIGQPVAGARLAVVGPGTGLGGCALDVCGAQARAAHCEPGHMGLAPVTDLEFELFRNLSAEHGEVFAELLVSGPGLQRLYRALAQVQGWNAEDLDPAQISSRALVDSDYNCTATLKVFCELLGSMAGDFVLANGAFGGLYLAGGIIPRMIDFLDSSNFRSRFTNKGMMKEHLEQVPVQVITGGRAGLIGAAHAPLN